MTLKDPLDVIIAVLNQGSADEGSLPRPPKIRRSLDEEELFSCLMENLKTFCGTCPDQACSTEVSFLMGEETVTCHRCLQTHKIDSLINKYETDLKDHEIHDINDIGRDFVRVSGLSNFKCKLLSPFLTTFGMDKMGNAVPLQELAGHNDTIDCGKVLGNRSFSISIDHVEISGYGKDCSGSLDYLADFLAILKGAHGGEDRLLPIHVDGDGHCLVHALSRALTGRELFWHSLRKNLYDHLKQRLPDYTAMFKDFHDEEDFKSIIKEANPDADSEIDFTAGLGNIHIFALSNILKRPIMLLDSPQKMQNAGDYTGLFLPVFADPDDCKNKSPICIAWSGAAHNHFVPLVPIAGKDLPTIPAALIPRVWGVAPEMGQKYLAYNDDGSLSVGDGKPVTTRYLQKLTSAMERKFLEQHMVAPSLVEDCSRYLYKPSDYPTLQPKQVLSLARSIAMDGRLFRCLKCKSLRTSDMEKYTFKPGGKLYDLAVSCHQSLNPKKLYTFPDYGAWCKYNADTNRLVLVAHSCNFCHSLSTRPVHANGEAAYMNGDRTDTLSSTNGKKVYWNGKEYDHEPHNFTLSLDMSENDKSLEVPISWFHEDSNPELNSDARKEAEKIVNEHFSQLPGSEQLVLVITNKINEKTRELRIDNVPEASASQATSKGDQRAVTSVRPRKQEHFNSLSMEKTSVSSSLAASSLLSDSPCSSSLPAAHKRKSNGEPTDLSSIANVTKSVAEQKCIVKISQLGGQTKTVRIEPLIDMAGFQKKVEELFGIEPTRQLLKHGFPPKVLEAPTGGGALGLKSGDKITLKVKEKSTQAKPDAAHKQTTSPIDYYVACNRVDKSTKLKELQEGLKGSRHSTMWDYAMGKPELFYPGGYFYEQFRSDIGLRNGQHCRLPLLEGLVFCYNLKHDRVELCLEPLMEHYPIDDEISIRYKKYCECKQEHINSSSDRQVTSPSKPSSLSLDLNVQQPDKPSEEQSKPTETSIKGNLAPGYHTVGESPTELSEKDIHLQRESIKQMVEKIQSQKQSSS